MLQKVVVSAEDDSQVILHHLTAQLNEKLGKNHFSYHVVTSQAKDAKQGTNFTIKAKSNDGELYELKIFKPKSEVSQPSILTYRSLFNLIPVEQYHRDKIENYKQSINDAYKASNSAYEVVQVQQQIDDENNYVYRVVGKEDGKNYKIKIERPKIEHVGEPVERRTK